jgi:hypothetical protein
MPVHFTPPGYRWFHSLRNVSVRIGIYTGVCLSIVLVAWVLIANRAPFLEPLAQERNLAAAVLLALLAGMPVLRFLRAPADLLLSGLVAWSLLTLTYRLLCMKFDLLAEYHGAFHVFVLGAMAYLVFATLSWLGIMVWRAREAQHTQFPR